MGSGSTVGSQEKGDAHASRVQRIVRDSDARCRATKRLFDPLAILKCAGPESGQRQRAGLAVYSFSQRLVRRLLTAADEILFGQKRAARICAGHLHDCE